MTSEMLALEHDLKKMYMHSYIHYETLHAKVLYIREGYE